MRLGALGAELREAFQQQPGRKDDVRRDADLGLPAPGQFAGGLFQPRGILQQQLRAPVEQFAGVGEHCLSALQLEGLHPEEGLQLLDAVGERGLTFVDPLRGLGVSA